MRSYRIRKIPAKFLILFLLIVLFILNPKILLSVRTFTFEALSKPLIILADTHKYFARITRLSEENIRLKHRVSSLSVELARLREAELENRRLRMFFKLKKYLSYEVIFAQIIGRGASDWRRVLIINKGTADGIREHMPCATAKGVIGRVVETAPNSSKIMLVTDPASRIGAILEASRESGLLIGLADGTCKLIYLPFDAEIKKGESVLTAGYGAFFPKGVLLGKVAEIGVEKSRLYKYAIVEPIEDMNKVEEVICIETTGGE